MTPQIVLFIAAGFLVIFIGILIINIIFGPHIRRIKLTNNLPFVSVLIPARNEAHNISVCLDAFVNQDYPDYEIIVLDDESEDNTAEIVENYINRNQNIRLIRGAPISAGWLGKNWACMQLQKHARGKILLFADADTQPAANALRYTVGWMQRYNLGLFSVFPQQITISFAEKLLVPLIDFILYTLLPLWTIYRFPSSLFAAANGQWIAFTRDAYDQIGRHEAVKDRVVEDVAFSKAAKNKRIGTLTASGKDVVYCRMYSGFREIWYGLSKNFFGLAGNNNYVLLGINGVMFIAYIVPYIFLAVKVEIALALVLIAAIAGMRLLMSFGYGHNPIISIIFHPIMILAGIFIALNSFYTTKRGRVSWKGRQINTV